MTITNSRFQERLDLETKINTRLAAMENMGTVQRDVMEQEVDILKNRLRLLKQEIIREVKM